MATRILEDVDVPAVTLILEAYNHADVGKYAEALSTIKAAKAADPRNIYVIALEKQFAKLLSLPDGGAADEARQTLPALLDRALDSARNNPQNVVVEESDPAELEREEKEARLKEVKDQYFTRADEFIERGDYQSALAEVKRVKIIDPGNRIAREYEKKIAQLAAAQDPVFAAPKDGETQDEKIPPPSMKRGETTKPGTGGSAKQPLPETDMVVAPPVPNRNAAPRQKKFPVGLIVAVAVVLLAGGAGAFYFLSQPAATPSPAASQQQTVAQQQTSTPPLQGPEQSTATSSEAEQQPATLNPPTTESTTATAERSPSVQDPTQTAKEPAVVKEEPRRRSESSGRSRDSESTRSKGRDESTKIEPLTASQTQPATAAPAAPPPNVMPEKPASGNPEPFVPVEKEPKVIKIAQPKLPTAAVETRQTGKVVVRVQIDTQGKPVKALISSSTNHIFDEAVIEAVMHSTFEPGKMSTGPVTTWMSIPFSFK
jgi:TonB family protein